MKKLVTLCLTASLIGLAGCGDPPKPAPKKDDKKAATTPATSAPEAKTDKMNEGEKK